MLYAVCQCALKFKHYKFKGTDLKLNCTLLTAETCICLGALCMCFAFNGCFELVCVKLHSTLVIPCVGGCHIS